jgi:hypothetical protein
MLSFVWVIARDTMKRVEVTFTSEAFSSQQEPPSQLLIRRRRRGGLGRFSVPQKPRATHTIFVGRPIRSGPFSHVQDPEKLNQDPYRV